MGRNGVGGQVLLKARCCERGDFQAKDVDFDPLSTYSLVASHEFDRVLFAHTTPNNQIVKDGQVNCQVFIEQPTDFARQEYLPGRVYLLQMSMYGICQAERICGSLIVDTLVNCFPKSTTNERFLVLSTWSHFILWVIVVDYLAFSSNLTKILSDFKFLLSSTFGVKLFGELKVFTGWQIR